MKKNYLLIGLSLLISLFIYLFYRTERTVINEMLIRVISAGTYAGLRGAVAHNLPLNDIVIYSLPEGLWIFCITLTSQPYFVRVNGRRVDCVYFPLIFCISLELLQLVHVTNGRFDWMDILVSVLFWLAGRYLLKNTGEKKHILTDVNIRTLICLLSYGIVYLAHVVK